MRRVFHERGILDAAAHALDWRIDLPVATRRPRTPSSIKPCPNAVCVGVALRNTLHTAPAHIYPDLDSARLLLRFPVYTMTGFVIAEFPRIPRPHYDVGSS